MFRLMLLVIMLLYFACVSCAAKQKQSALFSSFSKVATFKKIAAAATMAASLQSIPVSASVTANPNRSPPPPALSPQKSPWVEVKDKGSGLSYYWNQVSDVTTQLGEPDPSLIKNIKIKIEFPATSYQMVRNQVVDVSIDSQARLNEICDRNQGDLTLIGDRDSIPAKFATYSDLVEGGMYKFVGGSWSLHGHRFMCVN